jgi:hypothetical protein
MVSDFISKHSLHARYEDSWPMEDIEVLAKALHPGQSQAKSQTMNALRASAKPPVSMTNVAVMVMVRAFINKHQTFIASHGSCGMVQTCDNPLC